MSSVCEMQQRLFNWVDGQPMRCWIIVILEPLRIAARVREITTQPLSADASIGSPHDGRFPRI